ncbi:MAG: hypothetical protein JNL59_01770 [Chitinophagaceae bacterium]|nr:hypothetical protein [Chitinophagaceae bacterium]
MPHVQAQNNWSFAFSLYGGLPVLKESTKPDNFYLAHYDAGFGGSGAVYYTTKSNWQFGLLLSGEVLFTNRQKTEAAIVQQYSNAEFLNKVAIGGDPGIFSLQAEIGKLFRLGKWQITPFFRPSIIYFCPSSPVHNFYLKQKTPNGHYYQESHWQFSDTSMQVKFAPLMLTGGIRVSLQMKNYSLYTAVQYHVPSLTMKGVRVQEDFYGTLRSEPFSLQQQYSILGLELGVQIPFPVDEVDSKKNF